MPDRHLRALTKHHEPFKQLWDPVGGHITRSQLVPGVSHHRPLRAEPPPPQRVPQKLRDRAIAGVAVRVDIAKFSRELSLGERLDCHRCSSAAAWAATITSRHSSPWTIATSSTFARVQET